MAIPIIAIAIWLAMALYYKALFDVAVLALLLATAFSLGAFFRPRRDTRSAEARQGVGERVACNDAEHVARDEVSEAAAQRNGSPEPARAEDEMIRFVHQCARHPHDVRGRVLAVRVRRDHTQTVGPGYERVIERRLQCRALPEVGRVPRPHLGRRAARGPVTSQRLQDGPIILQKYRVCGT